MNKNIIYGLLASVMLLATSCIFDEPIEAPVSDGAQVTFSLGVEDGIGTRAISDGEKATKLVYAIYKVNSTTETAELLNLAGTDENSQIVVDGFSPISGYQTEPIALAKGQAYCAVFWAQNPNTSAYTTTDLTDVKVNYGTGQSTNNNEARDAFFASLTFIAADGMVQDVTLRRPFAQINVGVYQEDWDQAVAAGFVPEKSSVKIKNAATSINLLTGEVGDETTDVEVNYVSAAIPNEPLMVDVDGDQTPEAYKWLSMSYILVPDHSGEELNGMLGAKSVTLESAEFAFSPKDGGNDIVLNEGLSNVPAQRNWRTNIIGRILTGDVQFNITVDPSYYNDYYVEYPETYEPVDDGVKTKDGIYYIENPNGLKWLDEQLANEDSENFKDFEGVTFKLLNDIDLYEEDENGEPKCFKPIGSYRNERVFRGIFDGQGYTIKNLNQNTWALDFGYYYSDLGLGLFSCLENATIKNLVIDNASISGESALCGIVAATAYGDCNFENITIKNSTCNDYQYYAGGIVGWASGNHQYINCNLDESTIIGGQWGDFGNSSGGVIGGVGGSATILMKDCNVACRIDAVNDVVSAYQWYIYRCCGMLIGNTNKTQDIDGTTYAAAPQLTCENVKVTYGDWMNYHYCEFAGTGYPYVRVEAGVSVDQYVNIRYGHPTDANGNTVVDENHVHNDGEGHHICIPFDQLLGGGPNGNGRSPVCGLPEFPGVTVIYPAEYTCEVCGQQHNVAK